MSQGKAHLKIVFWNSRSIIQRKNELPDITRTIDIFICVESWLSPEIHFEIPGFWSFRKDRPNGQRGGGILFLVRKDLLYTELKQVCIQTNKVEIAGIRITNIDPQIDIVACYRPPGHILLVSQTEWNLITNSIDSTSNSILLGDFNAHNKKWNCSNTDTNGTRLDYSIELKNLFLHNTNSATHINLYNGSKSNIDLILSSTLISDKINTEVADKTYGSDHFPITIEVDANRSLYHKQTFKLKLVTTDWNHYLCLLEQNYSKFLTYEYDQLASPDKYNFFISIITESLKKQHHAKTIKIIIIIKIIKHFEILFPGGT